MITAEEAERIGLVNRVIGLSIEEERRSLPAKRTTVTTVSTPTASSDEPQQQEKQRVNEYAKILNKKLIDECLSVSK
jgi:enoyl-CoA hydratase/carnithine racemase